MERAEECNFRNDAYTVLIRFTNYEVSSFLSGERKLCQNDMAFFSMLLATNDELLDKAHNRGEIIARNVKTFLNAYKKVINDTHAYDVYVRQDELSSLTDSLFQSILSVEPRISNAFNKYWMVKCAKSVKRLYYLTIIANPDAPKFDGLSVGPSHLLFEKILAFKATVDKYLIQCANAPLAKQVGTEATTPVNTPNSDSESESKTIQNIPFLNYVYDHIVSKKHPSAAMRLNALRRRSKSASAFYEQVLDMDILKARGKLGISKVSAKEVNDLCDMMRTIVNHHGSKKVFEKSDKAALFAPYIENLMSNEHIRTYHTYQRFMESCNCSVLDFYLWVVSFSHSAVKFQGLNPSKSQVLLDKFKSLLLQIDAFLDETENCSRIIRNNKLLKLNLTEGQCNNIKNISEHCGHFPLFTAIGYLMSTMNERKFEIARKGLNVVYGQEVQDLNDIASTLNISPERVRQLRESCIDELLTYPMTIVNGGLLDDHAYMVQSEYDFNHIRAEENVDFSNEYITISIATTNPNLDLIGDYRKALLKSPGTARRLYLVPTRIHKIFDFEKFIQTIEEMYKEKRFYPYRNDLEPFVKSMLKSPITDEEFYDIIKECRQILLKGYPDNIINSQIFFPANARKAIPYLIEDLLREFNRPMMAEEICEQLNLRYPNLEQVPAKIGANALRNNNIVAIGRSSTYTLAEWNLTENRGGTIRDIVEEYLNSLIEPIASLSDICDYISKYRSNVKEDSVKANLLAESSNKYSLYYKDNVMYIGYSNHSFDETFVIQEKRQRRRSFMDSVSLLEKFIQDNQRFPFSSGVSAEEIRLNRFLAVCRLNIRKGLLEADEQAAIERIETEYEQYKGKKERMAKENVASWMDRLEHYVTYITANEALPPDDSEESIWYENNKAHYDNGTLDADKRTAFTALVKIVNRMSK